MIPNLKYIKKYSITGKLTDVLPLPTIATPEMYLQFARSDLRRPYRRNRVNALSNAKRGMHLHVDVIADALGIKALPKKLRRFFPQKLDFLSRCGILTPAILGRMNSLRNIIEHDYIIPDFRETSDFLDVVELFLNSSLAVRSSFPHQIHFGWKHRSRKSGNLPVSFAVQFYPGNGEIRFFQSSPQTTDRRDSLKIMALSSEDANRVWMAAKSTKVADGQLYYDWVSLVLSRNQE